MSIKEMSRVWADSKQKGSALLLLLAIADNANDDGICWPGTETLAKKTRMTTRNVLRLLDTLIGAKEISAVRRRNKGNVYVVLSGCTDSEIDRRCHLLSDKMESNVKDCHLISDIAVSHESSRIVKEPSKNTVSKPDVGWIFADYLAMFNEPVNPGEHDDLADVANVYSSREDIREAMQLTKSANARKRISRKVAYMRGILQDWAKNGKPEIKPKPDDKPSTPIKPKQVFR